MHKLRKRWNQLKVDDPIKLYGDEKMWWIVEKTGGAHFIVEDAELESKEVNFKEHYETSFVLTTDCENSVKIFDPEAFEAGWTAAELHYGINHHGSSDPDPLRELALKILKGDPQALDAARDILKS